MFGRNKQVPQHLDNGLHLRVQSVFPTIQGEGPFSGRPALFIRLHGCNLRCHWCDTDFESRPEMLTIDSLVEIARQSTDGHQFPLVVLTGGEPLLQNVVPLIERLEADGVNVQIETAGTVWVDGLDRTQATIVCSPKLAKVHPSIAGFPRIAWKYIIRHAEIGESGLPNTSTQQGHEAQPSEIYWPAFTDGNVYVQPCEEYLVDRRAGKEDVTPLRFPQETELNTRAAIDLCLRRGFFLSLQQHKIVNLP